MTIKNSSPNIPFLSRLLAGKGLHLALSLGLGVAASIFILSGTASAAGGVGSGGSGGGSGGGHQTSYGWGWVIYDLNGAGDAGPTDGFRNGFAWTEARQICRDAGATQVYAHIINDNSGDGMIYNYLTVQSFPVEFAGRFSYGIMVDHDRARTISTDSARSAF